MWIVLLVGAFFGQDLYGQCQLTINPATGMLNCKSSGTTGPAGATGPTGPAGAAGATGATGATGAGLVDCTETAGQLSCPAGYVSGATGAGAVQTKEASSSGTDAITVGAPDSVSASYRMNYPADPPTVAGLTFRSGTPSGGITQYVHAAPIWIGTTNANGYFDWTLGSAPGNPTAGDIRLYPKTGSTLCARDSAGTETCYGSGGGSAAKTYTFQGINQQDVPSFNLNFRALANTVFSTLDATHIRPVMTINSGATGSQMWSITPVVTTNPTINFVAVVRSTDATNAGSIAWSYACVTSGDSVDNPTPTGLTALSLTTIDPDSEVFQTSQAVTCSGTESAPADLYLYYTPTAPSGGTLGIIKLMVTY